MKRYKPNTPIEKLQEVDVKTYCIERNNPNNAEKAKYAVQVDGFCPLCGKTHYVQEKGEYRFIGEIAHVFPCNPTPIEKKVLKDVVVAGKNSESEENKIALCRDCHKKYDWRKNVDEYNKLFNIKRDTEAAYEAHLILNEQPIEPAITSVISSLANATFSELDSYPKLEFKTMQVRAKMKDSSNLLVKDVEDKVGQYFLFIQNYFKTLTEGNSFETICMNVKYVYLRLRDGGNTQQQIFDGVVDWMKAKTGGDIAACKILTSFFIQYLVNYQLNYQLNHLFINNIY